MFWSWGAPPCLSKAVVINQIGDHEAAIRGVLWGSRNGWLVLKGAVILKPTGEQVGVDGDMLIHRSTVNFIQVLP